MGFLSAYTGTTRVQVGDPEGKYWVDIKKYLTQGAQEKAEACLLKTKSVSGELVSEPDIAKYRKELVLAAIDDWNLDDENGHIWPINAQSVARLPISVFNTIFNSINQDNGKRTPEEQATFRVGSLSGNSDGDSA